METSLVSSAAPTSLQDIGKAISPQDSDTFDYDDSAGSLSTSSAAPILLQDSDTLQDSGKVSGVCDHGDFVDEMKVYPYTEEYERYFFKSFFCYPIRIGDVLEDTYRIEHKLGHGESSTVWLASDIKKKKDVALKIMIAEFEGEDEGEDEYRMQEEIISTVQDTSNNLVTYLTTFSLRGCKGNNHRVLVFPVRGPSFSDTLKRWSFSFIFKSFAMATRMSAARQLLKALECLHKAGIVHNGELTLACCSLINVHMLIILQI
jgi:hypothetical protein